MFSGSPTADTKALEQIFRHKVLKMLLAKAKITQDMIMLLDKWRHTGFNVFFGPRILPRQEKSMENLARYIIRASFSQERMNYHRGAGQVEYRSKDGKETKIFDALEWLAAMPGAAKPCEDGCSHVPNRGEHRAAPAALAPAQATPSIEWRGSQRTGRPPRSSVASSAARCGLDCSSTASTFAWWGV